MNQRERRISAGQQSQKPSDNVSNSVKPHPVFAIPLHVSNCNGDNRYRHFEIRMGKDSRPRRFTNVRPTVHFRPKFNGNRLVTVIVQWQLHRGPGPDTERQLRVTNLRPDLHHRYQLFRRSSIGAWHIRYRSSSLFQICHFTGRHLVS